MRRWLADARLKGDEFRVEPPAFTQAEQPSAHEPRANMPTIRVYLDVSPVIGEGTAAKPTADQRCGVAVPRCQFFPTKFNQRNESSQQQTDGRQSRRALN